MLFPTRPAAVTGGGKTQYALWLTKRLGRDVVLKRPSDLLSKCVGDSEKQIAEFLQQLHRVLRSVTANGQRYCQRSCNPWGTNFSNSASRLTMVRFL